MRRLILLSLCVLVFVACGDESEPSSASSGDQSPPVEVVECEGAETPAPSASPTFEHVKVLVDTEQGSVIVDAEMAETPEQRAFGLMFRRELEPDAGMIFLFFDEYSGGFYMKNTFIPLSIAYFDADGTIVRILDMEPCEEDSTLYDPGVPYEGALEMNQGAFDRLGISEGDRITITR